MREKLATLKDVARIAGVSTATVARVVHNRGYVSDETRAGVDAAIEQTGYRLNAMAQGLRQQRSLTLGHLVQSVSPNQFFAGVALGVDMEAAIRGSSVLMINTTADPETEYRAVETLIRRRVDAVLFTTVCAAENLQLAARVGIPVVQVERIIDPAYHGVTVDNYRGAYDAVDYLSRLGHQRIGYIGESPERPERPRRGSAVEQERLSGYRDALNAAGITVDPALVEIDGAYFSLEEAREATARLLDQPEPPTAIFGACDAMAAGALQECYRRGLRVPDDISIIGYDDTMADFLAPRLTTVRQPMVEIGQAATSMAFELLEGEAGGNDGIGRRRRLETRLIVRESTGPPAG